MIEISDEYCIFSALLPKANDSFSEVATVDVSNARGYLEQRFLENINGVDARAFRVTVYLNKIRVTQLHSENTQELKFS